MRLNTITRSTGLILGLALGVWSCTVEDEAQNAVQAELKEPTLEEALGVWDELDVAAGVSERSRNRVTYNYFEIFENQLFFIPGEGYAGGPAPGFYPGTGIGGATRLGKATSFINQFASFQNGELVTVGAPVTLIFGKTLAGLGLTNIPDAVSSVTVDNKGNAIYFKNLKNTVVPVNAELSSFTAEIEIIGGSGRFTKASGTGVVRGNFNPTNGKGRSVTLADLDAK